MARWELSFVLILLFAASALLSSNAFVDTPYFNCPATSNFTAGSTYQRNLKALFLNVSSDAAYTSGFASATSGQSPDQVQGLVLCRGDLSAADCAKCISKATSQIIQNCPNRKASIVWLDECFLRYSDQSFIRTSDMINKLLEEAISDLPKCCAWMTGARVLTGSCTVRYEPAPFFNSLAVARPPSTGQPTTAAPPPSDARTDKPNHSSATRVAMITVITFALPSTWLLMMPSWL